MNGNDFLGIAPPLAAFLAEVLTPVSEATLEREGFKQSDAVIPRPSDANQADDPDGPYQRTRFSVKGVVVDTAFKASKLAMVIPTWIGVTAGFAAAEIEIFPDAGWHFGLLLGWIAISAAFGVWFFAQEVYDYNPEVISRYLKIANIAAMVVVIAVATFWHASTNPVPVITLDDLDRAVKDAASAAEGARAISAEARAAATQAEGTANAAMGKELAIGVASDNLTKQLGELTKRFDEMAKQFQVLNSRIDAPLGKSEWKKIQTRLKVKVDGAKGSETCAAVRQYQQQSGYNGTGNLTPAEILALLDTAASSSAGIRLIDNGLCH